MGMRLNLVLNDQSSVQRVCENKVQILNYFCKMWTFINWPFKHCKKFPPYSIDVRTSVCQLKGHGKFSKVENLITIKIGRMPINETPISIRTAITTRLIRFLAFPVVYTATPNLCNNILSDWWSLWLVSKTSLFFSCMRQADSHSSTLNFTLHCEYWKVYPYQIGSICN